METTILHVSDTHLGKKQYGSDIRVNDYAIAFDTAIDIAIEKDVDAVIHTGDLFDNRSPKTSAVSDAFKTIKRLTNEDIPFLGIVGNHERKWDNQWLDIFENLDNVYRLSETPVTVNDVEVYGYDSIRKSEWEKFEFDLNVGDEDAVKILCMHELFTELVPPTKADRSLETVIDSLNTTVDCVALGDYHKAVDEDVMDIPAFYAGATERTSATQNDPTIRLINVEDGELISYPWQKIEGVREDVPRPFYKIQVYLEDDTTRTEIRQLILENVIEEELKKSVVVINLEGDNDSPIKPSTVYNVLEDLDVKVPYVSDKRRPEVMEFESEETSDPTSINLEGLIEDEIDEDTSDELVSIESDIVRDMTVNKSDIRGIIDERFNVQKGDKE